MLLLASNLFVIAENVIGPEGHKLILAGVVILLLSLIFFISIRWESKNNYAKKFKNPFINRKKIKIELKKDRSYYPDFLELVISNTGNSDLDIDNPLLIFCNIWLSRKFKLKGTNNYNFYPLYLGKGEKHTLRIDLNRFYYHDKSLKKFPRTKIIIHEVNGKKLGSQTILLRKTLFNF
jgi:hypothetical protein